MSSDKASEPPTGDGLYPIRTVSALTGVNPVTLRAWERRYGLIEPQRTPKGHRLYTEGDIERIHRILELLDQGISIGQTRRLIETDAPVHEASLLQSRESDAWQQLERRLVEATDRLDETALASVYDDALAHYPVGRVYRQLILPLSRRLARREGDEPLNLARRRFFSAFMRNKLGAQIHHRSDLARGPKILATCLPGEDIETELLAFSVSALEQGYRVALLSPGATLPVVTAASQQCQARAVVLFGEANAETEALGSPLGHAVAEASGPIYIGGGIGESASATIQAQGATLLPEDTHDAVRRIQQGLLR